MSLKNISTIATALRFMRSNLDETLTETLEENGGITSEAELDSLIDDIESGAISFELDDEEAEDGINGFIKPDAFGLEITIKGYNGVQNSKDSRCILYLEKYANELKIRLYGDNTTDEPTQIIHLDHAKD